MKKVTFSILLAVTFFSLGIRLFRLNEPKGYYFDEVYHVVTAVGYANNNPDAYNPFAAAPEEGTAYDWLHPPLAKLIQALSIKIIGDREIGWRLPGAIFGTAIIPATFILAYLAFGPLTAIFAALTISFENMTFAMSRITMNDVFITFFTVCGFIFALRSTRKWQVSDIFFASLFGGLAWASKWTGLYAMFAISFFILLNAVVIKRFSFSLFLLALVPPLVYLASYGQFWLQGHTIREFRELHKQIWWYQNRRDLAHSYGTTPLFCVPNGINGPKTWCPWILDTRPVYFSYQSYGLKAGYIYNLGNPIIFWGGVITVSFVLGKYLEERRKEYFLILIGYFIFWVPWIFSPRILFLHHYLPSLPFLAISVGFSLATIFKTPLKILAIVAVVVFALTFFYFYPISSGWPIIPGDIDKYMWLKSWR